ncbi:MAG: DUF2971 domain-containing protein [Candidatus Zixiibacteriota bacterium]
MASIILPKICNDIDDSQYNKFNSMPEYLESTLNEEKELYKYLPLGDNPSFVENIIRDNTIKFGAPNEFNDPFECMSIIGITSFDSTKKKLEELTSNSGKKYSNKALLRAYDEIVKISLDSFRNISLSKYGILCLSGTWDDILMWAHYSNNHKGIILIFQFYKDDSFYDKMMKVQYKKGITYFEIEHPNCAKKIWESFSTKDPVWKYENEYRVIHPPSEINLHDGNGIKPFPRKLLKGLIFGCRISPDFREDIIKMVKKYYPTLKLFDIILDESEVKLHKVPID